MISRNRQNPSLLLLLTFALLVLASNSALAESAAPTDSIRWMDVESGFAMAKETGKPVFLWFYGDWCGYCKKMTEKTFPDSQVIATLNTSFVPVRVETQSKRKIKYLGEGMTEADFSIQKFNARRVPSTWFVEPDGCRILHLKGFRPVDDLLKNLELVRTKQYGKCQNVSLIEPPSTQPRVRFLPDTAEAPAGADTTKK